MTKRLFLDTVRHILRELFEPLDEASVDVSVLGDLFDESHLRFEYLFVKLDVFNALPWPFKVQTAYIGQVHVQGMLGAVAGAPMTLRVRDVHIVLSAKDVDWTDVDGLRVANELYVALMHRLWNRHHMEGSGAKKTESVKMWLKRRIYATLDHMTIKVENIHIRIEVPSPPPTLETHVLGLLIPTFSVTSCESDCHILHRRDVPPALHPTTPVVSKVLMLDRITLYSAISATVPGSLSSAQWRDQFAYVWPAEAREPLLHPVRVQIKVDWAQEADGTAKYKIRAVDIAISHLDVTLKPAQVALLLQLCSHVDTFQRYVRYQRLKPYGPDRRPSLLSLPAFVFLPHWTPPASQDIKTHHKLSARARWQFALRCVLADLYPRRDTLWLSPVILMYTDLYKRQASPAYVAHITKSLVEDGKANTLPKYEPLSPHEADMLSDYIYKIALDHQLLCRAVCDRVIRQDFSRLNDAPHAPLLKRRSLLRLGSAQDLTSARGWKSLSNVEDFLFGQAALGVHVPRVKARDEPPHPVPAFFRVPRPMLHFAVASMRVSIQDETQSDVWVATTGSIAAVSIVAAEYVLLELRLGKLGLSISSSRGTLPLPVASIAYIHDEADGCIYIGVRYDPCSVHDGFGD
ncbi:hypothetical protein SPRG_20180 [Saprolegnia parasitica CBS 223.65]|uniref:Uncharacterized protein n=1 Tax=Saprolegnia parasitica (strain CBS 223.65) TaxID=695850 RepID=A0A067CBY3_SAPPC|nr:hypothetical protein SPRG_20180 [Saprolegnia parasitica CBS 223.65]KDO28018.1 hypothetical protein SPRG_20180 [Saprolegnia parasitica CBS 223.65]|eukprot:XP_012201174.1 hypothetical protein SPRG_20180 [Saprolegnia parasitica CBS 223.65]